MKKGAHVARPAPERAGLHLLRVPPSVPWQLCGRPHLLDRVRARQALLERASSRPSTAAAEASPRCRPHVQIFFTGQLQFQPRH
jgi:hypothetical protein